VFKKVLIANRGEIAIRIARTLHEMGIAVVAVFTDADRGSRHLRFADEAVALGADPRAYLDVGRILDAARATGAQAIHPGYGFLSENPDLPAACEAGGVTFIGPPSRVVSAMGNKQRARRLMQASGVPIVPGGPAETLEEARASAARIGYPLLVKATEGGGGKGMRRVDSEAELEATLARTRSEALGAFGSAHVHLEKALFGARHVEIQILGDQEGTLVHLYERDCSIQRRHQKILEETPCPVLAPAVLESMCRVAIAGAAAIGYHSAGTFEFLLDRDQSFYFLEMNTRLQVEHPITELVTGVDLVRQMTRVAAGERIDAAPPPRRGAAIEARIYAEDPSAGFLPSPGRLGLVREPGGPGVRVDSGVESHGLVSSEYDPLLAKLAVWGEDRAHALSRLGRALREYAVLGVTTNLEFLVRLSEDEAFRRGEYDTQFVEQARERLGAVPLAPADAADLLAALGALAHVEQKAGSSSNPPGSALAPWVLVERSRRLSS
jgi:acetyl-CoA carboxylase biotin carboxylase subunit